MFEFVVALTLCSLIILISLAAYTKGLESSKTVGGIVDMLDKPATVFIWTVSSMYADENMSDDYYADLCVFGGSSSKIPYYLRRCPVECVRCEGNLYLFVHDSYLKHISL